MAGKFKDALDAEISELERKLAAEPLWIKLRELQRVRQLYSDNIRDQAPSPRRHGAIAVGRVVASVSRGGLDRNKAILSIAESIIQGRTAPTPTPELLGEIQNRGREVHGKSPKNTLSAMLSHSERFQAHGRSGWTLVEPESAPENTEAADETPTEDESSTAPDRTRPDQSEDLLVRPVNPVPGGGT